MEAGPCPISVHRLIGGHDDKLNSTRQGHGDKQSAFKALTQGEFPPTHLLEAKLAWDMSVHPPITGARPYQDQRPRIAISPAYWTTTPMVSTLASPAPSTLTEYVPATSTLSGDPALDRPFLFKALENQSAGQVDQAEQMFRSFLGTYPNDPIAIYSLGIILMQRADLTGALALLDHGTTVCGEFAPLWAAKGSVQQGLGDRDQALACYDRAIELKSDYVEALINSGALLREKQQHAAALDRFQRVLAINPNYESALGNAAVLLSEFKRTGEAIATLQRLLTINPNYDWGQGLLCYERLHVCDWTDFEPLRESIVEGIRSGKKTCKSLGLMALSDSASDHQQCARLFAQGRYRSVNPPLWQGERYKHSRIKIAYISPDLREHPVGHLMAGIFERHDRNRFETIAISLGIDDQSRLRKRMQDTFDHFIDARALSSKQIAQLMREMEVDIAIDLAGYTSDARTEVFGYRPAPVHVNYLGYPGTLGFQEMDYIIADKHVIPPEHQCFYDEQVIYLPDTYLPTDNSVKISERTPTRAECGLPDDAFVFCSFNHDYKISPEVFAIWMRLLKQVPGSVLWLMSRSETSQANLRQAATQQGIDPQRLVFATRVPLVEDHLARYRQADLFLDTHPYNAHTTSADALMAGLPVITRQGQSFPARVAASVLHAAGMPELVTTTVEDYEALALHLATHPTELKALRAKLASYGHTQPLFDTDAFAKNLEAIYTTLWRKTQLGGASDALSSSQPVRSLPIA
jgi:protein O-GlcNAc transferase